MESYINLIVAILTGLAIAIPLVVQLVKYIKEAVRGKNYNNIMMLVMNLMVEAEKEYTNGADKKSYVLATIKSMEKTLNYDIDEEAIGVMIDNIVKASKNINIEKK